MNLNSPDTGKGNSGNKLVEDIAYLLDKWVDAPLTKFGKRVEDRRRAEGVYPPKEIYIPSQEDSQNCFTYETDVAQRQKENRLHRRGRAGGLSTRRPASRFPGRSP